MRPSARRRPEGVIEDTCTGGGVSEARKLVKAEGLRVSFRGGPTWNFRRTVRWNRGR